MNRNIVWGGGWVLFVMSMAVLLFPLVGSARRIPLERPIDLDPCIIWGDIHEIPCEEKKDSAGFDHNAPGCFDAVRATGGFTLQVREVPWRDNRDVTVAGEVAQTLVGNYVVRVKSTAPHLSWTGNGLTVDVTGDLNEFGEAAFRSGETVLARVYWERGAVPDVGMTFTVATQNVATGTQVWAIAYPEHEYTDISFYAGASVTWRGLVGSSDGGLWSSTGTRYTTQQLRENVDDLNAFARSWENGSLLAACPAAAPQTEIITVNDPDAEQTCVNAGFSSRGAAPGASSFLLQSCALDVSVTGDAGFARRDFHTLSTFLGSSTSNQQ